MRACQNRDVNKTMTSVALAGALVLASCGGGSDAEPFDTDRACRVGERLVEETAAADREGVIRQIERLDDLDAATGEDADRLFFQIMADHHLGGIRMGDHAKANGARQEIIDFAASVSRNQAIEIAEYQAAYERLGLG